MQDRAGVAAVMVVKVDGLDVVVADDSEQMRAYSKSVLELVGAVRVREACDGREAFRMICGDPPNLLITDCEMAPGDGIELTRSVRNESRSPNPYLPVIMVTAYTDTTHIGSARDAGVSGLLHKPVAAQELLRTIADVVDDPKPFIRTRAYFGPDRRRREVVVRKERRVPAAGVAT
jgi:CheY-like chemotaxis protein